MSDRIQPISALDAGRMSRPSSTNEQVEIFNRLIEQAIENKAKQVELPFYTFGDEQDDIRWVVELKYDIRRNRYTETWEVSWT